MIYYYLLVALVYSPIGVYYYFFFKRIYSLFSKKINNWVKDIFALIAILIVILSSNPFGVWIVIFSYFFAFSLFTDLIMFILNKIKKENKNLTRIYKCGIIPLTLTIILLIFANINMTNVVEKKYDLITTKKLNTDYKIVFLSDLHYPTTMNLEKLEKYTEKITSLNADIVILGGDIIDENTTKKEMIDVFETLGSIKSKYGVFFVYGNHDKAKYNGGGKHYTEEELATTIEKSNIKALVDDHYIVNNELVLLGRDDTDFPREAVRKSSEDLLEGLDKNNFLLLIDHHPNDLKNNEKLGYDLQLSGHTHGGQIFPTGMLDELFNKEKLNYGYRKINDFEAIVTSGMGGWSYPFRTGTNSEYLIITIKSSI